jgi:ribosomal protein L28
MARTCIITGLGYQKIHKRSHSMQDNIVRRKPNLVIKKVGNKKVKVAARTLRTLKKKGLTVEEVLFGLV